MMSHNWKRYWMGWWSRSLSRRFAEANISVRMLDLPPSDVHFFGLKKGYVQIITSGLSSVLACGQRGAP